MMTSARRDAHFETGAAQLHRLGCVFHFEERTLVFILSPNAAAPTPETRGHVPTTATDTTHVPCLCPHARLLQVWVESGNGDSVWALACVLSVDTTAEGGVALQGAVPPENTAQPRRVLATAAWPAEARRCGVFGLFVCHGCCLL
jgi:hypothetical protein